MEQQQRQVEELLQQLLLPDNTLRRAAEAKVKEELKKGPEAVPLLVQVMRTSGDAAMRQLAAVLLRRKFAGQWARLPAELQEATKAVFLESIVQEPSHLVRRAEADAISVMAQRELAANKWPGLLPFLWHCSQSPQEEHHEVALVLFRSLMESCGEYMKTHFDALLAVLARGLQDQHSNKVRVAALKAVGSLVGYVEDEQEVVKFREVVRPVLDVARHCAAAGEEGPVVTAFEIFDELVESPAPLLGASLPSILHFALETATNCALETATRYQAAQLVSWLARWKPKALQKHLSPVLSALCPLLAEAVEDPDADDMTPPRFAAQALDAVAVGLPSKLVLPPVLAFVSESARSREMRSREAATVAIAAVAEGCCESIRRRLPEVLGLVLRGARDADGRVREGACLALGQLAEHLQPEINEHYADILGALFLVLDDASPDVKEKAYYALAAFCENLEEEILPYLEPLLGKLVGGLSSTQTDLQQMCLSAIGSTAAAAEEKFAPYAEGVLSLLPRYMLLTQEAELPMRARALELVAIVAQAVKRPAADALVAPFLPPALGGFAVDSSELREYTHGFFGTLAQLLEGDFAPYLEHVVPQALASCRQDDGTAFDFSDSENEEEGEEDGDLSLGGGFGGADEAAAEKEAEEKLLKGLSVRTGVLDEKAAATQALGLYALHCKAAFQPYLKDTLEVLQNLSHYFHADVRLQALIALQNLFTAAKGMAETEGPHQGEMAASTRSVFEAAMEAFLQAADDDDMDVLSQACGSIADVLQAAGAAASQPYVEKVCAMARTVLSEEALCQIEGEDGDDSEAAGGGVGGGLPPADAAEEEGDEEDAKRELLGAAAEMLPALAALLGPAFAPLFEPLFPLVVKFAGPTRPPGDRTLAVGTLAGVVKGMGQGFAPYCSAVLPLLLTDLQSDEAINRRNAAFCAGLLAQHCPQETAPFLESVLRGLHPLLGEKEPDAGVTDNAAGAIARVITANPSSLPLGQILPVLVGVLPLKEDQEEATPVYGCLCHLLVSEHHEVMQEPMMRQVAGIFAQVAPSPDVSDDVKKGIGQTIRHLVARHGPALQALLRSLPQEQQSALALLMRASA